MRLRWTVVARGAAPGRTPPWSGEVAAAARSGPVDVVVDGPVGVALRDIPGLLPAADDVIATPEVSVAGVVVPPDAVVGRAPLLDGAVLTLSWGPGSSWGRGSTAAGSAPSGPEGSHLLELVVLAGPDAATVHPLRRARLTCGRAATNDVVVRDPRLSRTHCELLVGPHGVHVVDSGSTNGTQVLDPTDDASVSSASTDAVVGGQDPPQRMRLGGECRMGASLVALRRSDASPPGTAAEPTHEGTVLVRRSPRARRPEDAAVFRLPAPARGARSTGFPVLAVVLPALAAGGLALWTGSAVYLLLAGLGPLLVAGGWLTSRRDARREGVLGRREHARACAALRDDAERAARALAALRRDALPDAHTLLEQCRGPHPRVWERDPQDDDAFRLRLGVATGPAADPGPTGLRPHVRLVDHHGASQAVTTAQDLVSVDLRDGALGVVEPGDPSLVRFLLGQLTVLLPAGAVAVAPVIGRPARDRWRWLALLPHLADDLPGDARSAPPPGSDARTTARWLAELVSARAEVGERPVTTRDGGRRVPVLVVVDDPAGELDASDLAWLPGAHLQGVHVIAVGALRDGLPRGCSTLLTPVSHDAVELVATRVGNGEHAAFVADRVGGWWSERVTRALAPLRPSAGEGPGTLPTRIGLEELLDTRPDATVGRWSAAATGLDVPLGVGRDGVVRVDLTRAGPHALVAGTTGSGKSELLRAWLLALALSYPPEHVAFLLVDYKGGATFDDLADLPHTVGLLSDLDGGATARVLHSLRAEVRRRERLMAAAGARDVDELRQRYDVGPLPRLLVVVDEFRVLAEDAPDVLSEFVRLAATGRSLGIHLVLATQRPAGVVSADIRANAGLRIALRVQDPGESRDVVDRPDAAWLPPERPGRAVVVGSGVDVTVQSAWVGDATGRPVTMSLLEPTGPPTPPLGAGVSDAVPGAPSAARRLVAQLRRAASATGRPHAESPWLPPLPVQLTPPDPGQAGPGLLLGVTDLPWEQSRGALRWDPTEQGPALVLGGPRSGRSTTLAAAAYAARRLGVPVVQVRGDGEDDDHVTDLLAALAAPREPSPAEPSPADPPPADPSPADPGPAEPQPGPRLRALLLVDDTDALLDPATDPTAADLLGRILRTGHRSGVGVMVAGGRTTAVSRLTAGARVRLVHRTSDPADALVAGVPSGARTSADVPGRCLAVGLPMEGADSHGGARTWVEAQVFHEPGTGSPTAEPPRRAATAPAPAPGWLPVPLPRTLRTTMLPAPVPGLLPVAVVSPTAEPWGLDTTSAGLFAVAGPRGSGRSNVLRTLEAQARRAGLGVARLGHQGLGRLVHVDRLVDLLLVDDAEQLDPAVLAQLEQWVGRREGALADGLAPGATVVLAGLTDWFADEFRGLPAGIRRSGQGIVLAAGRTDARNVLGARDGPIQRTHLPGRGLLLERGRTRRIHLAVAGTGPIMAAELAVPDTAAPREHYRSQDA